MQHQKKWSNQMYCESSSTIFGGLSCFFISAWIVGLIIPRDFHTKMAWSFLSLSLVGNFTKFPTYDKQKK